MKSECAYYGIGCGCSLVMIILLIVDGFYPQPIFKAIMLVAFIIMGIEMAVALPAWIKEKHSKDNSNEDEA